MPLKYPAIRVWRYRRFESNALVLSGWRRERRGAEYSRAIAWVIPREYEADYIYYHGKACLRAFLKAKRQELLAALTATPEAFPLRSELEDFSFVRMETPRVSELIPGLCEHPLRTQEFPTDPVSVPDEQTASQVGLISQSCTRTQGQ